ncbi:hypothetical protein DM01DRAFT_1336781 [Hesseltinella vesiculosa]|uniref:Uncharacterized protein n=1 Tax=Hesseltinella vesiculosa TaxID=101127 RepID=A0A1X2GF93_9FUNG|nr:hypothetical protein DM01DRAFT_1336781 [Hesseltinella vesiculosa]
MSASNTATKPVSVIKIASEDILKARARVVKDLMETTVPSLVLTDDALASLALQDLKVSYLRLLSIYSQGLEDSDVSVTELNYRLYDLCLRAKVLYAEYDVFGNRGPNNREKHPFHSWIQKDARKALTAEDRMFASKRGVKNDCCQSETNRDRVISFVNKHHPGILACEEAVKLYEFSAMTNDALAVIDTVLTTNAATITSRLDASTINDILSDAANKQKDTITPKFTLLNTK